MASRRTHWEEVYDSRSPDSVSWFEAEPAASLRLVEATGVARDAPILDVGAGASRLLARLNEHGYTNLHAVDISESALDAGRDQAGHAAVDINWIVADVTAAPELPVCQIWHDRAVFHFLTEDKDRIGYVQTLLATLDADGFAIIATFGPRGPTRCSGLPVARYDPESLAAELGAGFRQIAHEYHEHTTPDGRSQQFLYTLSERLSAGSEI